MANEHDTDDADAARDTQRLVLQLPRKLAERLRAEAEASGIAPKELAVSLLGDALGTTESET